MWCQKGKINRVTQECTQKVVLQKGTSTKAIRSNTSDVVSLCCFAMAWICDGAEGLMLVRLRENRTPYWVFFSTSSKACNRSTRGGCE
jgi:hypothetical protein